MLLEMGYNERDSKIALQVASNNLEQACTFLLSNPNPAQSLGYQATEAAASSSNPNPNQHEYAT